MNTTKPDPTITLEDIAQRKTTLKKQLDEQRSAIIATAKQTFAPSKEEASLHPLMQSMSRGLAIYDGMMTGIKVMRRIKSFLKRIK